MAISRPPLRILLVEDNPADERLLRARLQSEASGDAGRAFVHWAQTLAEAVAITATENFDVILLDLDLPDARGISTVRRMHEAAPNVPVVVFSGHDDPEESAEAVAVGAQDALTKGAVDGAQLWRAIGHALERQRADAEIRTLNAELERRVQARTRELALANEQLEAFVRSASHDLKAPLRSVAGMVHLLSEEHGHQFDPEARVLLDRVERAVERMDTLIGALLKLSLLGRAAPQALPFDLARLARTVFQDLLAQQPHRIVSFECPASQFVIGDEHLCEILLQNLLGNALKFTARTEEAHVQFGALTHESPTVFFVRDNGAGFDMQFADKLFRPFQRLHGPDEFPGTGIGLATAHRVTHMHGGEIWADGVPGGGASFFFTLEPARA